jgi:hypothetical protein
MTKVFSYNYNGAMTSWNGSVKTFMNYPKEKQLYLLYALENAPSVERERVHKSMTLTHESNQEGQDMLKFIMFRNMTPAPEISIVSCLLTRRRGDTCTICLCQMKDMSDMAVATSCRHVFCRPCIVQWAQKNKTCPVCRGSIEKTLIHLGRRDIAIAEELDNGPPIVIEKPTNRRPITRALTNSTDAPCATERIFRELNLVD